MPIGAIAVNIPLYLPIILYIVGLFFACIEMFTPGFGLFGILGILCFVGGITLRVLMGGGAVEIILTIVLIAAVLTILFAVTARSARSGRLSKTPLILSQNAVSTGMTEGTKDYSYLLSKEGVTTTFLRPVGKAEIDGELIEVISDGDIIEVGERIKVIDVEGQKVIVKKI